MSDLATLGTYLSTPADLRIIAIPLGRKGPIHKGWNEPGAAFSSPAQFNGHDVSKWSWGLHHLDSRTMCLDIDDLAEARWIFFSHGIDLDELLEHNLQIRSGRPNRAKLIFRMPDEVGLLQSKQIYMGEKIDRHCVIDFRCVTEEGKSVQDVLPPSIHPDTGRPYEWHNDAGLGPMLMTDIPRALVDMWLSLLEPQEAPAAPPTVRELQYVTRERVADALRYVSPDVGREDWYKIGMSIHSALGEEGFDLFDQWSSGGVKYRGDRDTRTVYRSFREKIHGITYRTLWAAAKHNGWVGYCPTGAEMAACWANEPDEAAAPDPDEALALEAGRLLQEAGPLGNQADADLTRKLQHVLLLCLQIKNPAVSEPLISRIKDGMGWNQHTLRSHIRYVRDHAKALMGTDENVLVYPYTANDKPLDHSENFRAILEHRRVSVRHNRMLHDIEVMGPRHKDWFHDEKSNLQVSYLKDLMVEHRMPIGRATEHINTLASEYSYHPFAEMLDQTQWDGRDWFAYVRDTVRTTDPALWDLTFKRWACSVVVAARESYGNLPPRGMIVMTGKQYVGKTSFFRYLIPEGQFGEGHHLDLHSKDQTKIVLSKLVVELGELEGTFRRSDLSKLKAFISSPHDEVRLPYAAKESRWKRRTVFCGTVNDPQFLADPTGNTRFWVNDVRSIDLDLMEHLKQSGALVQFWAHVDHMVRCGERWVLSREEMQAVEAENSLYVDASMFDEMLMDTFAWPLGNEKDMAFEEDMGPSYSPVNPMTLHEVAQILGLSMNIAGNQSAVSRLRQSLTRLTGVRGMAHTRKHKLDLRTGRHAKETTVGRYYPMPYLRSAPTIAKVAGPMLVIDGQRPATAGSGPGPASPIH